MEWTQAIELIEILVIVVALFLLYRSVPREQVDRLLARADRAADGTPSTRDDLAVDIAQALWAIVQRISTPVQADGPVSEDGDHSQ